MAQLTPK
jgi:malate dehydrogenase (oxaloacetate-decarboxylating)(NADP+)